MTHKIKSAIQLNKVYYSDGDVHILKNITVSFAKGKITTLVGPSGAGKTTLIKLCNGLISPSSGDISIHDQPMASYDPIQLRRQVGIALQEATMIAGTVMNNLSLPLKLQGKQLSEQAAKDLLTDVGLEEEYLHRNVQDLSGGQRQKVSIARTLVNKPDILLLDEITSALDRISQQEIEELIRKINEKYETTIVWITHNLDQALKIGDHSVVMMNGEVIETGESSFLNNPVDHRVKQFVKGEWE